VDLTRLRGQMPVVAFILLAVVCFALLGFGCACLSDQPALVLDRTLQGPAMPALVEVWQLLVLGTLAPAILLFGVEVPARGRASPAFLQRFLF
jgi:hypothetical protein